MYDRVFCELSYADKLFRRSGRDREQPRHIENRSVACGYCKRAQLRHRTTRKRILRRPHKAAQDSLRRTSLYGGDELHPASVCIDCGDCCNLDGKRIRAGDDVAADRQDTDCENRRRGLSESDGHGFVMGQLRRNDIRLSCVSAYHTFDGMESGVLLRIDRSTSYERRMDDPFPESERKA